MKSTEPYLDLTSYNTMYYITVSIIVILCGGYVSGECRGSYTDTTVNSPLGNCQCIYYTIIECVIAGHRDCKEWFDNGHSESGIYPVNPDGGTPFKV